MIHTTLEAGDKGWLLGPWNAPCDFALGWARVPRDIEHYHVSVGEAYIVVSGSDTRLVGENTLEASSGDLFSIELGVSHGWVTTSPDFIMFMVHHPVDPTDKVLKDASR